MDRDSPKENSNWALFNQRLYVCREKEKKNGLYISIFIVHVWYYQTIIPKHTSLCFSISPSSFIYKKMLHAFKDYSIEQ